MIKSCTVPEIWHAMDGWTDGWKDGKSDIKNAIKIKHTQSNLLCKLFF